MAPSTSPRSKVPAGESRQLIIYRLEAVETAVKDVGVKLDHQDNIKRQDLLDFKDAILERFAEKTLDMQKQIDDKAEKSQVDDLRTLVKAIGALFSTIIAGLIIYYLTQRGR